jgi:ATP-dependent Clp protease ATP-binding subunit ClpA
VRGHEFVTPEHLLLALIEDQDAAKVFAAFRVSLDMLKNVLQEHAESTLVKRISDIRDDPKPTVGFNRAVIRAVLLCASTGTNKSAVSMS